MGILRSILLVSVLLICGLISGQEQGIINTDAIISLQPAEKINSKFLEFAPMYYGGGIVFVHARDQDKFIDKTIGTPYFEIMYSDLAPDGMPLKSYNFSSNIRTKFHEGPSSFNSDFSRIYFTRSNYSNGKEITGADGKAHMKIYSADKGAEDWENITELPFCSDDFDTWGPALSPDGNAMVFVSNRPEGYGGMDLYLTTLDNGIWSEPVNLGPRVNTAEGEAFPYWHPAGVLFFATRGREDAIGRLDIYAVRIDNYGVKSDVEILPVPINSKYDDLTFICNREGTSGFFASSRKEGKGKDDIYAFTADPSLFNFNIDELLIVQRSVRVMDAVTGEPVTGASVWCFPVDENGGPAVKGSLVRREVNAAQGGKKIILERHDQGSIKMVSPDSRADNTGHADFRVALDKDALLWVAAPGYSDEKEPLKANKLLKTDAGEFEVFLTPSDILKEVETADVEAECVEVTTLVLDRANSEPVQGARVTLTDTCNQIMRIFSTDSLGVYTDCLKPDCVYKAEIAADGYSNLNIQIVPVGRKAGTTVFLDPLRLADRANDLREGDIVVLKNIYYDFNKSAIRKSDTDELEDLARIMTARPGIRIELRSYTDSRGTEQYNMELSERRAVSAMEFLVSRGIDASRIELRPMGETQLLNHCSDGVECSEAEHQQNRRTEFVVLSLGPDQGQ